MVLKNDKITTFERAARVISEDRIQFMVKTGEFVIQSDRPNGLSCVVKLKPSTFSSMSCSCPGTALCFHIIAAQIASNCSDHSSKRPRNTTTMRKNAKKSADKRSGCKKPRALDVDLPSKKSLNSEEKVSDTSQEATDLSSMKTGKQVMKR